MERASLLTKLSAKNGLIISAVTIVISLTMYFIDPLMAYTSFWVGILLFVVFIGLLVYAGITIRKEVGGYWTFGEAFKSFLVMALILAALSTLYNVVLMAVIDPSLPETAGAVLDENSRAMMAKFGMDEDKIEEAVAQSGSNVDRLKITPKNVVTSFGAMLAVYAVIALIMAAILKKKEPLYKQGIEE